MRNLMTVASFCFPLLLLGQSHIGNELAQLIERESEAPVRILITLNEQLNIDSLRTEWQYNPVALNERPRIILESLEKVASASQDRVIDYLDTQNHSYELIRKLKIVNMLSIVVHPDVIPGLATHTDVRSMMLDNSPFQLIEPVKMEPNAQRVEDSSEPGLSVIGAREMWELGYTGRGRLAYSVDTGIWPNHPSLKRQWKGHRYPLNECWLPWDRLTPGDKANSHGSHTTGTILGLDTLTNDTIGVAFNAYFIASDPVVSNLADIRPLSDYVFTYEWCLNPDGDIQTHEDVPDAINNSWGRQPDEESPYCDEDMTQMYQILEIAGIANLSSAGNEGPAPQTMGVPHNISINEVNSFTLGSVNGNNSSLPISDFSSRGPGQCGGEGSLLIKPEVVAPGESVRSCVNQDEYANYSGTSMACPHGVGAFLLLKEAFPNLPGQVILEALYMTAIDLGEIGEDNTYGMGVINVFDAYNYLIDGGHIPVPPNQSANDLVITEVLSPQEGSTCNNTIQSTIRVKNSGTENISGFQISFGVAGTAYIVVDIDEMLIPNQEMEIDLPPYITGLTGSIEMLFRADMYDDVDEIDFHNNQIISRISIKEQVDIPYTETFESEHFNAAHWHHINSDNGLTWELFETDGLFESEQSARMNLYDYSPRASQEDDLVGPRVEMPGSGNVYLAFDMAYQLRNGPELIYDTLMVWIATDCALSDLQPIYEKGGADLNTFDTSTHDFVPTEGEQWRHEVIDISEFATEEVIIPVFRSINRKGNNLYIDNVAVYQDGNPLGLGQVESDALRLFPNPAKEMVTIAFTNPSSNVRINLFDATGRLVLTEIYNNVSNRIELSVEHLVDGMYVVLIETDSAIEAVRMVKQ